MKRIFLLGLSIVLLAAFLAKCGAPTPPLPTEIDLTGQVFIVTQGGTNFKLGLVEVKAIEEPLLISSIQQKKQNAIAELEKHKPFLDALASELKTLEKEYDIADRRWNANIASFKLVNEVNRVDEKKKAKAAELATLKAEVYRYFEGPYWVADLPIPVQTAKTDADGNFVLRLKPGKYALVSESHRKVGEKTEQYYWLVWVDVTKENQNRIFLSNDNLLETFCIDCVVKPTDISFLSNQTEFRP